VDNGTVTIGKNWAGYHEYTATMLHRPTSLEQLQEIVAAAPRIRALGTRHSFNDLADSGELVTLEGLHPDVVIDEESESVSFSAGLRYGDLGVALEAQGWALRNLASLPHISVGGAISTGTHGSGDRNGTLSRAVSGLEFVTADGGLRTVSPADDAFDGAVVALGALGIVTRVTLDIEPSYQVRQDVYVGLGWSALLDNLDSITSRACSVSIFTPWTGDTVGAVWMKSRLDERTPPQELYGIKALTSDMPPIAGSGESNMTAQGGIPGAWIDRMPHFRMGFTPSNGDELQSEYLIPRQHAVKALTAIRALADRLAPHLIISELRTMSADSLWLSPAYDRDALAIHFTWKFEPEAVLQLLPVIERALEPFDARPHWGKLFNTLRRDLYPKLPDFVALAEEFDPEGKFRNAFLEKHVF